MVYPVYFYMLLLPYNVKWEYDSEVHKEAGRRYHEKQAQTWPEVGTPDSQPGLLKESQKAGHIVPGESCRESVSVPVTQLCPALLQTSGLQSTRLLCPWGSLGKSTGVGCHAPLHWGKMDTCICMAESLHCLPGTTTTLLISYTRIQKLKVWTYLWAVS